MDSGSALWTIASGYAPQHCAEMCRFTTTGQMCTRQSGVCPLHSPGAQGWLGSKDATLHAGEGAIHTARWSGTLVAWADNVGVKVPIPTSSSMVELPSYLKERCSLMGTISHLRSESCNDL